MKLEEELRKTIELHSQVLHSEAQAISARDLSTIDDILAQKDESLGMLLSAKESFGQHLDSSPDLQLLLEEVIEHQRKNTEDFRKLHVQGKESTGSSKSVHTFSDKVSRAYRK